jgi:hypothetical protein
MFISNLANAPALIVLSVGATFNETVACVVSEVVWMVVVSDWDVVVVFCEVEFAVELMIVAVDVAPIVKVVSAVMN